MKNQDQINLTQDNMKIAIVMTMLIIVDTKSTKPKMKSISFDFGLSGKVLKGITSELVDKSLYGNYLTKEFVTLIFQPIIDELTLKVKALEDKDKTFDNGINSRNNILNNIVISVSLVGPSVLILFIVGMILLRNRQAKINKKINDIRSREESEQ